MARVRRGVARARYSEKPESVMYAEWPALSVQWRAALAGLSGTRQGVVSQLGAARVGSGVRELCPCVFSGAPGGLLGRQVCAPRQANEFPRTGAEPPRLCLLPLADLRGAPLCAPQQPAPADPVNGSIAQFVKLTITEWGMGNVGGMAAAAVC